MYSGGCNGCITFLLIRRDSVFAGLNLTSQVFAHFEIFLGQSLKFGQQYQGYLQQEIN